MCPSGINDFPMTNADHIKVHLIISEIRFSFELDCYVMLFTSELFSNKVDLLILLQEGLSVLAKYRRPLLVHAEIEQELEGNLELEDSRSYSTYLKTSPASW